MAGTLHDQDRHDYYGTGSGPTDPAEPLGIGFWWNGPDSSGGSTGHTYTAPIEARSVCGNGQIYFPAGASGMYAVALSSTGFNPAAAWHSTAATFRATPAYEPLTNCVFAGGSDGLLYKLNASTGATVATYTAGGGALRKFVTIVGVYVYVVGFDGKLHKVHVGTMRAAWVYTPTLVTVTNPISGMGHGSTPAVYSPSRDVLVYCTDDLFVHAVNNADGSLKWRVKPTTQTAGGVLNTSNWDGGVTFERGWPVVADRHGFVLLRLQIPGIPYLQGVNTGLAHNIAYTDQGSIQTFLNSNALYQNVFAMKLDDGSAASFIPAVLYGYMETGARSTNFGSPTAVSQSGTATTVTISSTTGMSVGSIVEWAGCSTTQYNGAWSVVSIPDSTHFTFTAFSGGLGTPSTMGTIYLQAQTAQMPTVPLVKVWPNGDEVAYSSFRQGAQVSLLGTITALTSNGTTATATVPSTSGIGSVGTTPYQPVIIQGSSIAGFNTITQVTITDATHFTFPSSVNATAATPGTYGLSQLDWRWDGHMGEMALDGTTVGGLSAGQLRFMRFERSYSYSNTEAYTHINDEQGQLSLHGSSIFRSHFFACEGSHLDDRSTAHGFSCADPMPMTRGTKMLIYDTTTGDSSTNHLSNTTGLTAGRNVQEQTADGRFWDAPGYWMYWDANTTQGLPPGEVGPESWLSPNISYGPHHAYVTGQYLVIGANAGDTAVFTHSATVPVTSGSGLTILT